MEGTGPDLLLQRIRALVAGQRITWPRTRADAIIYELGRATERIDLRLAQQAGAITLGTGQSPGTYNDFGRALARHATERGLTMHAHPTEGSVENGFDIQASRIDFGLVQSDVAEALFEGIRDSQLPLPDLRGVASLWPEVVHVVTLKASGIQSLSDLRGKRLAIGEIGSGTRVNSFLLGRAAGLERGDFLEMRELSVAKSIADLEAGEVDAIFVTEALPSRALQDLTQRRDDVRFVSAPPALLQSLTEEHFAYYGLTIPAKTYPGQQAPFRALALAAVLVTNENVPDDIVTSVLGMLLDGAEELSRTYYRAAFISRETVRLGMAVPLHPAAERFYQERESARQAPADRSG